MSLKSFTPPIKYKPFLFVSFTPAGRLWTGRMFTLFGLELKTTDSFLSFFFSSIFFFQGRILNKPLSIVSTPFDAFLRITHPDRKVGTDSESRRGGNPERQTDRAVPWSFLGKKEETDKESEIIWGRERERERREGRAQLLCKDEEKNTDKKGEEVHKCEGRGKETDKDDQGWKEEKGR